MSKSAKISTLIVIVLIVIGAIWYSRKSPDSGSPQNIYQGTSTAPVAVSVVETTKVSDKAVEYQNAELGFSVKYPNTWEKVDINTGVQFIMPVDKSQVSTVAKLQADINAVPGKCAFPPVTTIKERTTVKVGDLSFNMISMSNTVQGRNYFNRMYSLQKEEVCYFFSFASITQSPSSKNLTGSNATQAENNNRAIVNNADTAFTNMVKSFTFVTGPAGQDEIKVAPVKK